MIYRLISSKTIIGRISRLVDSSDWKIMSSIYLQDAVQKIGLNHSTVFKASGGNDLDSTDACLIPVINHLAKLPDDLEILCRVESLGVRLAYSPDVTIHGLCSDDYIWGKARDCENYYTVIPDYLKVSFETGTIKLFYKKFQCDSEGYIMIPDIAEFKEACVWKVFESLLMEGIKSKNPEFSFFRVEQVVKDKIRIAQNRMKQMTRDEREALSQSITSVKAENNKSNIMIN